MSKKNYLRVNIMYRGTIPILGCIGPIKNVVITEEQLENIEKIIGPQYTQVIVSKPKKTVVKEEIKVEDVVSIEPVQAPVEEVLPEAPKEEEKVEEVVVEEAPKPAPKKRGGRKPAAKKVVEEAPKEEEKVEE